MARRIIALDIDLGRIHAYSDHDGRVCFDAPEFPYAALATHDLILAEVASAVDTSKCDAEAYNRRKWAVGNALQVGRLWAWAASTNANLLVAPADKWTLGHSEQMRNAVACTAGQDNHDIRSCREMLHYFGTNPDKWVPPDVYYKSLSKAKGKHEDPRKAQGGDPDTGRRKRAQARRTGSQGVRDS